MILSRDTAIHLGKTIKRISAEGCEGASDLVMAESVLVEFTDGSKIVLRPDWRGTECYISETQD